MNINLPAFGIKIKLTGPEQSCGSITSDLHEKGESPELKAAIDSIEGLILAHACTGMDVKSPSYLCGIETVVLKVMNQYT